MGRTDSSRQRAAPWWAGFGAATLMVVSLIAPPAHAAGLLVADGGFGGLLEIKEHTVDVTFNNGIVVTTVNQVFVNTEPRQVEALYTFPVPEGASVANFSMWIGGKEMVGEVVEKERARKIYDSYKRRRRDPGLLEQADYRTFEMRIFPIGPRAEQRVQITYYQELDVDSDWATYVYPLATATRTDVDSRTRGRFALTLDARSEIPIESVTSPSHGDELVMARHTDSYWQASLETTGGDLNRDVVLAFKMERPHTGLDLVASRELGEDGFFQLSFTAGDELGGSPGGMDYVFVLDVSGSMGQDGKLSLSRRSAGAFVEELSEDDRFELMSFNVAPETLFRSLRPATRESRAEALEFLGSRRARGGTVLRPALQVAYDYKDADRPLNVVVLSDGMTEQRERAVLLQMLGSRPSGTRVFCIGVGNDVNRPLLSQLADEAGGLAAFVSRGDDFERQARAFRRKLLRPAASNVEIDVEGVGVYDVEPERLPDLFHGSPLRLYGRYRDAGPARVHIRADVGGEVLDTTVELDFPGEDPANPEIERMWAWHRIQRLQRDGDRQGTRSNVVSEIVRLGESFSIVTEYTSFLVLENDAEYQRWKIDRRNALRTARDRKQQECLRTQLEKLRERSAAAMGPVEKEQKVAGAAPPSARTATPAPSPTQPAGVRARRRSVDVQRPSHRTNLFGGEGGGGAIDPMSAVLALLMSGSAFAAWRRRR
jgi:Ca-activated chloride channel family protein